MPVKEDLREAVNGLKQEVKELKEKVKELLPFGKRERQVPVKVQPLGEGEHPVLALQRATNQLFDQFLRHFGWPVSRWGGPFDLAWPEKDWGWPRLDLSESEDALTVVADLPGVDKDEIEVSVVGNRLTIKGEKKAEEEHQDSGYYRLERSYGAFYRSLWLPCEVDPARVEATYRNGVLKINLPKTEAAKSQSTRIPVLAS